jgi:hypothetical protein
MIVERRRRFACFLSHDWGEDELGRDNHGRVGKVCGALQDAGLAVWFDEDELSGDVNLQMANGIEVRAAAIPVPFARARRGRDGRAACRLLDWRRSRLRAARRARRTRRSSSCL